MDRIAAMIVLLGTLLGMVLMLVTLFVMAPIICSCLVSLLYTLYLFMAYEESGFHRAQELENRFWTIFAMMLTTALLFAKDSPLAFGLWNPILGLILVLVAGYAMHVWDRYVHRLAMSQQSHLRRRSRQQSAAEQGITASQSLVRLRDMGIPVEAQLAKINECLKEIDQLLIPSTINNMINLRFILAKEREIISIIRDCDARALNYMIANVKLGLLFYKIKDHRNFNGKHRTELINLLAVERLPILTVMSRVIVLHSLQLLKLRANPRAEFWVRNILLNTNQEDLSDLKTLTDAKGDYFCMNKLIYDDIRSESVRQDILTHIRREAAVQLTHMQMGTSRRRVQHRMAQQYRKVLSDVDDTLYCSGGMYPAGVDRRYSKKTVYPGVLAFYRELDLGTQGPEQWEDDQVGNLVFLSARPHVYRDMSEKANFAKFEKLRARGDDGRQGMHTTPSLLAGDLASGSQYLVKNDMEPLARKKFDNFRRYVSIYPEYQHVFVCDNGQGDVRAGELMFDSFPYEFETLYVHVVQDRSKTYGYDPQRWRQKEFSPFFFRTYPEAALYAASRNPPQIRSKGLQRICQDSVKDFLHIKQWPSEQAKAERRQELNQHIWEANDFLVFHYEDPVELIPAERKWIDGERVRTPYGIGRVRDFDACWDLYSVDLDWRPLDVQIAEGEIEREQQAGASIRAKNTSAVPRPAVPLETVVETDEEDTSADRVGAKYSTELERKSLEDHMSSEDCQQEKGQSSAEESERTRMPRSTSLPDSVLGTSSFPPPAPTRAKTMPPAPTQAKGAGDKPTETVEPGTLTPRVSARVSGRLISKYTPPAPQHTKADKQRNQSLFTFLSPIQDTPKPVSFKAGDDYATPYGPARVIEHRQKDGVVVVKMIGWTAQAYLQQDQLKPIQKSILGSLLRQFSAADSVPKVPEALPEGTKIVTPFGHGAVVARTHQDRLSSSTRPPTTVGIHLESWTLADGSHPTLYCTLDNAKTWKDKPGDSSSILSALGSALVTSSRSLLVPFQQKKPVVEPPKTAKRYYADAAAVTTSYGNGRVVGFRETDGFYTVSLTDWVLAGGQHPKAFMGKDDIRYRLAKGCHEGYPVLTCLGLSGTLASVDPTTGIHLVTIPSAGMVCYLQPECVVCPLKAAVGEDVLTAFGDGKVEAYNPKSEIYTIRMTTWNAKLYAKADTLERVSEGIPDHEGSFGVSWLLRFFFAQSSGSTAGGRSRSNSLVSGTHSNRSVT